MILPFDSMQDHHGCCKSIKGNAQHDAGTLRNMHIARSERSAMVVGQCRRQDRRPPLARRMVRHDVALSQSCGYGFGGRLGWYCGCVQEFDDVVEIDAGVGEGEQLSGSVKGVRRSANERVSDLCQTKCAAAAIDGVGCCDNEWFAWIAA